MNALNSETLFNSCLDTFITRANLWFKILIEVSFVVFENLLLNPPVVQFYHMSSTKKQVSLAL